MGSNETKRVVKADEARGLGSKIAFNYEDLRRRCDDYMEQVRSRARQMIEDAHAEADTLRKQAYEKGLAEGREEGRRRADEEFDKRVRQQAEQLAEERLNTALPAVQSAAETLKQDRDRWLASWEEAAVRLSVAIAEKLIHRELDVRPESTPERLRAVLELAAGSPQINVRMHPQDVEALGGHADEVVRAMAACGEATVKPDETIDRGGCVIETRHGVIDARLQTQLERIADELIPESGQNS